MTNKEGTRTRTKLLPCVAGLLCLLQGHLAALCILFQPLGQLAVVLEVVSVGLLGADVRFHLRLQEFLGAGAGMGGG